jgi:hypothetical protein
MWMLSLFQPSQFTLLLTRIQCFKTNRVYSTADMAEFCLCPRTLSHFYNLANQTGGEQTEKVIDILYTSYQLQSFMSFRAGFPMLLPVLSPDSFGTVFHAHIHLFSERKAGNPCFPTTLHYRPQFQYALPSSIRHSISL